MFDPLLHQSVRSKLVSLLVKNGELPFGALKKLLDATDGNLSSHLKKLEQAGYVEVEKFFEGKRPKTVIKITRLGRKAFEDYIKALRIFLKEHR